MICIKDDGYYLTIGKYYEIQSEHGSYVSVINDIGKVSEYPRDIFKEVD